MKKILMSLMLVLATAFVGNAYANDAQTVTASHAISSATSAQAFVTTPALNAVDMQAAFQQDAQTMQVASLSGEEMKATEGAWFWVAIRVVWFVASVTYGIPPAY